MATKKRRKRFHVSIEGGTNLQGEHFENGDSLRVEPDKEIENGCLAYMRIGRVGNQHTWTRYIGRFFEGKRGCRTFRLLDPERTILNLEKEELAACARGERIDIFRVTFIVHRIPHATILSNPWFEGEDGKKYWGPPPRNLKPGKAA